MEEFKNSALILLSDYKSRYSAEKKINVSNRIEHFLYVQNFLQEFEEKAQSLAGEFFNVYGFSPAQREEAFLCIEEMTEQLAAGV
ncbi:hypothetical protein CLV94_0654 [Flavobacterium endophyticum]|uniref:Uncharacterized protein n=1 Tax=Flavobacterium endophyticum TaxID=1540163 RepID=A0A495MI03_9FLAO|nr:hypothetical protein [Flavobacterium endophyticum]RKS25616.1 hypothetical protein CLV94_0654 [Flavobacterium endophyticum]